ncbi:MAG: hypothetical protein JO157_10680, partial [Acetobacteraceae bacterium]|nr:hypothetical protein [Acetobacteraceae bacterium]
IFGLRAIADGVSALASGTADRQQLARLTRWSTEVRGRGACHHPDGATRFVQSALRVFADDIDRHRRQRCNGVPAGLPLGPRPWPPSSKGPTIR